jgi:hypothetical protein
MRFKKLPNGTLTGMTKGWISDVMSEAGRLDQSAQSRRRMRFRQQAFMTHPLT